MFIDDVLKWGKTPQALYETMKLVFERLKKFNVKVNLEKCQFVVKKVKYLGHILCREGIKPTSEKLRAIEKAPRPQNVTQLKSFLGMVMFYSKCLKNLNAILAPMYK
jgi:Reverse transcriptase (RNA-dependent DNA polymerase)